MSRPLRPEFASLAGITCLTRSAAGDIVATGAAELPARPAKGPAASRPAAVNPPGDHTRPGCL